MTTHFIKQVPQGDTKLRDICNRCSHVNYENPRVILGTIALDDKDRVLLIDRGGEWTLPYDFMRVGESSKEGAARIVPDAALNIEHLVSFDEMPESGIVVMTFRGRARQSQGVFFSVEEAREKLAGNPAALHAMDAYAQTRHMNRLPPDFLRHAFHAAARPVLDMLHVPNETCNPPGKACNQCDFDKGPKVKLVSGVVATLEGKILLGQRAIPPRIGYWTLPSGFMELGETMREGAAREAMEETGADVEVGELLAVYEIPEFGQVMPVFRGTLKSSHLEAGVESQAVGLFTWPEILTLEQQDMLAFPMVREALNKYDRYKSAAEIKPCHMRLFPFGPNNPPRPGSVL